MHLYIYIYIIKRFRNGDSEITAEINRELTDGLRMGILNGFAKLHNYILGLMSTAQPSPKSTRAERSTGLKA